MALLSNRRWQALAITGVVLVVLVAVASVVYVRYIRNSSPVKPVACSAAEYRMLTDSMQADQQTGTTPLAQTPPMGFSSYPHFGTEVDEQQIVAIVGTMAADGLNRAGYRYINIDDGWQGPRLNGQLTANNRFPCGLQLLGRYIHAHGFKLGLYTTPGPKSCGGFTGSAGYVSQDVATFASWGVDAIKLDWCSADYQQAQAITRQWHDAIDQSGRPMLLSINAGGNPWTGAWAKYLAQSWRTSDDICPSWYNKTRRHAAGASACYGTKYQSGVYDYLTTSNTQANAPNVGPGHWADPDSIEAGNTGLTYDEAQTQFGVWSMWSAPLILGCDPRQLTPAYRSLVTNPETIAIDQDRLGAMAKKLAAPSGEQIWMKALAGNNAAYAFVNLNDTPRTITIRWASLGVTPSSIRNVFTRMYLPDGPVLRLKIPRHGIALLRVGL
jgi:alpha-galactosidase